MNHRPRRNYHFDMAAAGREGRMRFLSEFLREVHRPLRRDRFPAIVKGGDAAARLHGTARPPPEPQVEALVLKAMLADLPQFRQ